MMRYFRMVIVGLVLAGFTSSLLAQTPAAFRVLFGVSDTAPSRWDGTITVKSAGEYSLEPWRFELTDDTDGTNFHLSTHPARLFLAPPNAPVVANGFIVTARAVTEDSEFDFTTAQGDFSFRAAEVPYGKGIYKLGDRVYVDRVPVANRLTETPEEEDDPSLAPGRNGEVWLAYVQFHHSVDADKLRASPPEIPKDFSPYAQPTGGDQVWARRYSRGSWGDPIAITSAGRNQYKTAVATDGNGRAWVFWSENHDGDFDIFARAVDASGAKNKVQISSAPDADIDPVATTDATGRVWVAWQGWRNGIAAIYAAHQKSGGFTNPEKISESGQNEWDPAIAADKTGRVAIAWDSYRNGNYDVYARITSGPEWGSEIPVAASARYEAYPSLAFDPAGRLWIAYEEGGKGWGKDFGAYASSGVALYQGRVIRLRGLEPSGRPVTLDASLDTALVGPPGPRADRLGSQADTGSMDPDPEHALHRKADSGGKNFTGVSKNTLPRLMTDGSGRIWLAFRTPHPTWWNPIGTVWTEYLISFDGKQWTRPIFLNHTDNLLDNRPACVSLADGRMLMVNSSDNRRNFRLAARVAEPLGFSQTFFHDPYNNDLWSDEIDLGPATGTIPVVAAEPLPKPEPATESASTAAVQVMRNYRGGPDGDLRLARGEFHRHSAISMDGGGDGSLSDQWRYILDSAALDWVGCCDHDNGGAREYSWWITQKLTEAFNVPGKFIAMFSYERSVAYPEGHRNVIFAQSGIRPLPRYGDSTPGEAPNENHPIHSLDTQMLYAYLKQFNGIVGSHTSATAMGTDWRDNDPDSEPVVEIYQGARQDYEMPGAPRSNSEKDSLGGWRPKGFVSNALNKGYRLGFEASSDHGSTHISYSILYVKDLSRESVLDSLKKRHVYAATDNILADVESGTHMMGDEFSTAEVPSLKIKLRGTAQFARVSVIRDGHYVYSTALNQQEVEISWRDNQPNRNKTSYYYVRGEQANGEIVWVSPMWIRYTGP